MRRMDKFFTTEEAAAELGVTPARTRQLIRAGVLRAQQFGRAYVVTAAAITEARRRHSKPGPVPKAAQTAPVADKRAAGRIRATNGSSPGKKKGGKK